jgi:hypothetical protein
MQRQAIKNLRITRNEGSFIACQRRAFISKERASIERQKV